MDDAPDFKATISGFPGWLLITMSSPKYSSNFLLKCLTLYTFLYPHDASIRDANAFMVTVLFPKLFTRTNTC